MELTLQNRVLDTIARHSMIRSGDCVGAAVSGGADSVALLRLLGEMRSQLGIRLVALHFNHQLRGAEADRDELFVASLAREFGLDFVAGRADVSGEARRNGWNLEDAARRLRYRFFAAAASAKGLHSVAVAHTADDQAETVLARLFRGTGPTGLAGIHPVAGQIIRPFLDVRRRELRDYLGQLYQPWREDATNQDTSRTRARIRHNLLPLLEQDFDPAVVTHLGRLASLAGEEETFWNLIEESRFSELASREPSGTVSVRISELLHPLRLIFSPAHSNIETELPSTPTLALTRRLVRRIFLEVRGDRQQLTSGHVEDVLRLATQSQSGSRIELPGVLVERQFDRLVFSAASQGSDIGNDILVGAPGARFEYQILLPAGSEATDIVIPEIRRRFNLKVVDWHSGSGETTKGLNVLDFDKLRWPLILRNWLPGDSYRPHRRRGVHKLKRMLLESRIPRRDRTAWPVLTSAGALAWALQCPVADEFAVGPETRTSVLIAAHEF
jgi:tRNA(Ile)-lysidine synthase